jgi:molecular chaperone DnaK
VVVRDFNRPNDGEALLWMIEPKTEIPASRGDVVRTVHDDQRGMAIRVYESTTDVTSDEVTDHVLLVEGDLVGLPAGLPKGQEVRLDFELGADGILRIQAQATNGAELRLEARISGQVPPDDQAPLPGIWR